MGIVETEFNGLYIFTPNINKDERGYVFEAYNANNWKAIGEEHIYVQDNESKSKMGTIRGLHYQIGPYAQTKLIGVNQGAILDIALDLRKEEPTYGKYFSIVLNDQNRKQVLLPKGFAHGFAALSTRAVVNYKSSSFYNKDYEYGIQPLDPTLNIDWGVPVSTYILSEKDKNLPAWGEHKNFE